MKFVYFRSARTLMHMTDKVNGIVIINTNESHIPDHYSPDYSCPDSQYGRNLFV